MPMGRHFVYPTLDAGRRSQLQSISSREDGASTGDVFPDYAAGRRSLSNTEIHVDRIARC